MDKKYHHNECLNGEGTYLYLPYLCLVRECWSGEWGGGGGGGGCGEQGKGSGGKEVK